jgi:type II secretory pathway component PulJ
MNQARVIRRSGPRARAFTLVEALIAVAIISLVLTLVSEIFLQAVRHSEKTMTDLGAESMARIAMTKVVNDLRQAMPPYNASNGQLPVLSPSVPAGGTATPSPSVTFTEADSLNASNFTNPPFDTVTIAWNSSNDTITRVVNGGSAQVIAFYVTAFSVLPISNDEYQVSLTVSPPHRGVISSPPFTATSSVFISYYKTNS